MVSSCKCQNCGEQYKVDFLVPDYIWEEIKPEGKAEGAGLLCGKCICSAIESFNKYNGFRIVPLNLTNTNDLVIKETNTNKTLSP